MCDYRARELAAQPQGTRFEAVYQDEALAQVALQVPGRHNVSNALAALAAVHQSGVDAAAAADALGKYHGSGRRFDLRGVAAGVTVIDDYGHHPTEIRSTLEAARQRYPDQAVWAVWQPHTYSRVKMLFNEFSRAFEEADHVVVTEVYASRETAAIGSFSAQEILPAMRHPDAHFVSTLEQAVELLLERLQAGDVLVVFSAGDADQISARVLVELTGHDQMKIG
jgi:UDP-N-acetylmuramate--alanine ligase